MTPSDEAILNDAHTTTTTTPKIRSSFADTDDRVPAMTVVSTSCGELSDHEMDIVVPQPSVQAPLLPAPPPMLTAAAAETTHTVDNQNMTQTRRQTGRKRKPKPVAVQIPMKRARTLSSNKKIKVSAAMTVTTHDNYHNHNCSSSHVESSHSCIDTGIPPLNKIHISPSKIVIPQRIPKRRPTSKKTNAQTPPPPPSTSAASGTSTSNIPSDIPSLCPVADTATDTNITTANAASATPSETKTKTTKTGQIDVAYSTQYPQVGFPYIYNEEADANGKRFTCKFMDCNSSISSAAAAINSSPIFCNRQFAQKCHWMRHCLEKHVPTEMGQRYACRYCDMKYAQNSSLKEHVAVCHSNKPPAHKCPFCVGDVSFTRWTSVLRHCRNQHPDQPEPAKTTTNTQRSKQVTNRKTTVVEQGPNKKRRTKKKKTEAPAQTSYNTEIQPPNIMPQADMSMNQNMMSNHGLNRPNAS